MSVEKLPKGWRKLTISKIGKVVTGNTPSKGNPEFFNGNIPWVKPGDVKKSRIVFQTEETLTELGAEKARLIPPGSVIVTCIGDLGNITVAGKELATNQQINSIVVDEKIADFKYIYYWSLTLKGWLIENSTSTTISMVNKSKFENAPVILPPLPEQQRIVAKLDAVFGHLDRVQEKLDRIPELLKNFRQQVLTQAVTGVLTREWREGKEFQNIQNLVDEMLKTKEQLIKSKKIRKEKRLAEIQEDQKLMNIPDEWKYIKIGELSSFINGDRGKNYPNRSEYVSKDGVAFINTGHIEPNGSLDITSMNYISKQKYDSLSGGKIMLGDLVYCLRGATLGKTAVVTQFNKGAIASSLVIIRPIKDLNNWYLYYFLTSPVGKKYIRQYDNGSAQPNLSAENVRNYVIGLPSLEEQEEVVQRVEALFSLADKIESQYQSLKSKIDQIPQAVLAKAFRGELVEQEVKEYVREIGELGMVAEEVGSINYKSIIKKS
jgi:type I restriction enzyme S subunit